MGRLRRFVDYRFVGRRDQMIVYDCDDEEQFGALHASVAALSLDQRNLLQAFSPDTRVEARNRGFRQATPSQPLEEQVSTPAAPDG